MSLSCSDNQLPDSDLLPGGETSRVLDFGPGNIAHVDFIANRDPKEYLKPKNAQSSCLTP